MPIQATRIVKNCTTGEEIIETYEIPDPTPEEVAAAQAAEQKRIIDELTAAVQNHLDAKAKERNYDGILSACTYATSTNAKFQVEGQACVEWRDACWATAYNVMDDVLAGNIDIPTKEELISKLPELVWPL